MRRVIGASHVSEWQPNSTHWAGLMFSCFSRRTWNTDVTLKKMTFKLDDWDPWSSSFCGWLCAIFINTFPAIYELWKQLRKLQPCESYVLSTLLENIQRRWKTRKVSKYCCSKVLTWITFVKLWKWFSDFSCHLNEIFCFKEIYYTGKVFHSCRFILSLF